MAKEILNDKNIICISTTSWEKPWGSRQQIMRLLAGNNRIIFIESPISIFHIILSIFQPIRRRVKKIPDYQSDIKIYTPFVPLIGDSFYSFINKINSIFITIFIKRILKRNNIKDYIIWTFSPRSYPIIKSLNPQLIVYHCIDNFKEMKLPLIRKSLIKEQELQLAFASDVVFACSNYLVDYLKNVNQKTYYLPSAVEKKLFEKEFLSKPKIYEELKRPIFLMIANFDERIDTDLIIKISNKFQDSSIVLIGGMKKDVIKKLSEKKNIIFLNYIKRDDIANYINYSDICFIAYKRNEFINGISPIKLYEYLAFGKPVVTTYFPETEFFDDLIYISNTDEEFLLNIDRALDEDIETSAPKRINFAQRNTWNARLKEINKFISGCFGKN